MQYLTVEDGHTVALQTGCDAQPERVHVFSRREIDAVNAALGAGRPLLVRGEPGVGKTQLAEAVAVQLQRFLLPFVVDARSESRDLLWHLDAVQRLADAQLLGAAGELRLGGPPPTDDPGDTEPPVRRLLFALREAAGRYEIPFGSIERPAMAGQEVPALRWADVSGLAISASAGRASAGKAARRGEELPAGCDRPDGPHNGVFLGGFWNVAPRTGLHRAMHVFGGLVDRHDDDAGLRMACQDLPGDLDAMDVRQNSVHQCHIGAQLGKRGKCFGSVARLADDLEITFGGERPDQPEANHEVIVDDENADARGLHWAGDGSIAGTSTEIVQPVPGEAVIASSPPILAARSRMPNRPK